VLLPPASGNELLILQSSGLQPYHEAAEGVFAALDPTAIRRIVILYHPGYSAQLIADARNAALHQDFELVALPASAPTEVGRLLNSVTEKVQAVWMIPDPNVLNRDTAQIFLDYSLKKRIVLLTFAEKYLKAGATFGVAVDNGEMGREAGRLALHLIEGHDPTPGEAGSHMAYRVFQNTDLLERMADLNTPRGYHLP
jgi:ABC-type uncharacterized transport system substrate-binding protein